MTELHNRFRVINRMGKGGFGQTYLAEDLHNFGEKCVVKQLIYAAQGTQANQKIVELFTREAKQLQKLRNNLQIPDLLAYFESQGYLYLVQQLVDGEDLQKELLREGVFGESKIRDLLLGVLPILSFIHEQGVLHRDLKPPNIMRHRETGTLLLIDFGVSKEFSAKLTTIVGVTSVGTQGYSPYEQLTDEGTKPEPASDLFSLGATCFHLMTGIFPGDLWARQGYGWCENWAQHLQQSISPELTAILTKLLKFEVRERYQSAAEVLKDLQNDALLVETELIDKKGFLTTTEVVSQQSSSPQTTANDSRTDQLITPHQPTHPSISLANQDSVSQSNSIHQKVLPALTHNRKLISVVLGILVLFATGYQVLINRSNLQSDTPSNSSPPETVEPPPAVEEVSLNQFFEVNNPSGLEVRPWPPTVLANPAVLSLSQGSVIKVVNLLSGPRSDTSDAESWLEVQLCDRPNRPFSNYFQAPNIKPTLQKGDLVWVEKAQLQQKAIRLPNPDPSQFGVGICNAPSDEG